MATNEEGIVNLSDKYDRTIGFFDSPPDNLATISYVDAYIAVYQETTSYYEAHPHLSENYNKYISTEQFVQDKRETITFLKELDKKDDKEAANKAPDNNSDGYYQNAPLCLKKLWAATKILCAEYQGGAGFSYINSHLQGFVIYYHPAAHHSPKEADQNAKTPKMLVVPQAVKKDSVFNFLTQSLPSFPGFSTTEDNPKFRHRSFSSKSQR